MNGRYKGWRTDTFCRIGPYDRNKRCFWSPLPPDKQVWLATAYGFTHALDTWRSKPVRILDVIFQQILEAINERRLAIKTYVPHFGISETDWFLMWRNITWQDMFAHLGATDAGYLSLQRLIAALRAMIWNEYWKPYDVSFYKLNPWLLPLARFFCYPTDGVVSGTNWQPFDSLESVLEYAKVGGLDADKKQAWTLHPKRHGRSPEYNRAIIQYPAAPLPFYCEYTYELKLALDSLEYLYPALGFSLTKFFAARTEYSACADTLALADYQAQLAATWDATSPTITAQTKNDWPGTEYRAYVPPPTFGGCSGDQTRVQVDTRITRWSGGAYTSYYKFLLTGYYKYNETATSGWLSVDTWLQESGASLAAKLTGMLPEWLAEWSWKATNARKYIEFDYHPEPEIPDPL